jgi:hypothetical protein
MELAESPWTLPPGAVTTQPYELRAGFTAQLWRPSAGEPHLPAWYEPLAALCRRTGTGSIWRPFLEDCRFVGRVEPKGGPVLWLYVHEGSGGEVLVDIDGVAHLPRADRRRKLGYRFEAVTSRAAAFQLGLHRLGDGFSARTPTRVVSWHPEPTEEHGAGARVLAFRRR